MRSPVEGGRLAFAQWLAEWCVTGIAVPSRLRRSSGRHLESIYLVVLEVAGLDRAEGGSFRLRHSFALRELRRGFHKPTVAQSLGVKPLVMER